MGFIDFSSLCIWFTSSINTLLSAVVSGTASDCAYRLTHAFTVCQNCTAARPYLQKKRLRMSQSASPRFLYGVKLLYPVRNLRFSGQFINGATLFLLCRKYRSDISGITRKSTAKNRIGEADFLMRQQRSRFHLPYIPECTLYAQAQTRSEYTDPPPIPPARSHLS